MRDRSQRKIISKKTVKKSSLGTVQFIITPVNSFEALFYPFRLKTRKMSNAAPGRLNSRLCYQKIIGGKLAFSFKLYQRENYSRYDMYRTLYDYFFFRESRLNILHLTKEKKKSIVHFSFVPRSWQDENHLSSNS